MNDIFSPRPSTVLYVDINSCFATIEQQANPLIRGKPVVVAAYATGNGCILASSIESKRLGIKTGMHVREAQVISRDLTVLTPDPEKYRHVNVLLKNILSVYTDVVEVYSIDEMSLDVSKDPYFFRVSEGIQSVDASFAYARKIKERIRKEIGEWIRVSIGISTNVYLGKVASDIQKPDGCTAIIKENVVETLKKLSVEDLCGIKKGYGNRLRSSGMQTAYDMYRSTQDILIRAFGSKIGRDWWLRLHGFTEGDRVYREEQKTYGQSHALYIPKTPSDPETLSVLSQLVYKMARRLRETYSGASGVSLSCVFSGHESWQKSRTLSHSISSSDDFYKAVLLLLNQAPSLPIRILAVSCFGMVSGNSVQEGLFDTRERKDSLTHALDIIGRKWGDDALMSARALTGSSKVLDRIPFGRAGLKN
ncbi:hypothetical protein HY947_03385 [Candidatus Gottesmanbacteria bacterium]|nr:hypothetical protein [Candidatus Gottesmanbacteria bacterium]